MPRDASENAVYLSAPVNALVEGLYEENTSLAEIRRHGDFGLGTFNDLDGEMLLLDGVFYQTRSDGLVYPVSDSVLSPFACVTNFVPLTYDDIEGDYDFEAFNRLISSLIPSQNMLYAIRIDGLFPHVRTRSVPKQENYRPLAEVASEQPTFDFDDVAGTLAGFYTPRFMASLNVPGFHLHFLSQDLRHGGHLLNCRMRKGRIALQIIRKLELALPVTFDYLTAELERDTRSDLEKAER
ncbi:MAG: Alpha-acetolactate decarboxylase [Syntrophorhabdaceae bacterium PtaU1.Bin034]|jgi:acetolactate decarboxylase|nr:MAG: Alpha-acetolactate decarboxylase [Syntrophorhabdaceae bacterium PtaU1.Bin034]